MAAETYDLIVIGGGRASNLALGAAAAGWKTALIERDKLGGACPNRGCVPSKLLIGFAEASRHVQEASRHFVDAEWRGINLEKVFSSVNDWIVGVDERYAGRLENAGVRLFRGEGRFVGPRQVAVGDEVLTSEKMVVATGSRPVVPPYRELPVWTSDDLFPLQSVPPKSLLVIGGGVIGTEMSAFFAGMGTETHLFARKGRLLGREDGDIENVFQNEFGRTVGTHCHASLKGLSWDGERFTAVFDEHGEERLYQAERVLFAIGRKPNTEDLDLGTTGLTVDRRGFLPVNDELETEVAGIFATGDVNGRFMLQHAASYEVHYLRQKFLRGATGPIDEKLVAHAIFSHPEVASIGLMEEQLKERGTPYVAVFQDWLASARAMASRLEYPRIKLLVSPEDYSILGCHLVGPEASTLLHQVMMLMRLKNDVRELAEMIYIHPALNECLLAAAVAAVKKVRSYSGSDASA